MGRKIAGGRSVAPTLAAEWKRPSRTRGQSYSQFASMLHLRGFHEQAGELSRAASEKGVVSNLDLGGSNGRAAAATGRNSSFHGTVSGSLAAGSLGCNEHALLAASFSMSA